MADERLYVTDAEKWLSETASKSDLLCIVIFRGSWCKYDQHYLQKLGKYRKEKAEQAAGEKVQLIAWTSEGEAGAARADTEWQLTTEYGYDAVLGDETNALAKWLIEDEVLPNLVTVTADEAKVGPLLPPGSTYPNGIVMPGMVWYAHHGSPVFQWEKPFEAPDYGGPGRPDPESLWAAVIKRKHALDHGNAVMPSHGAQMKMCTYDADIA